jgi:hypothetical protein
MPPLSAARQRRERLADAQVAEPHVRQPVEDLVGSGRARLACAEELPGLSDGHPEHLADVPAAEAIFQHRRVEALPLTLLTGAGDTGHHGEIGVDDADAVAGGAGTL